MGFDLSAIQSCFPFNCFTYANYLQFIPQKLPLLTIGSTQDHLTGDEELELPLPPCLTVSDQVLHH